MKSMVLVPDATKRRTVCSTIAIKSTVISSDSRCLVAAGRAVAAAVLVVMVMVKAVAASAAVAVAVAVAVAAAAAAAAGEALQ